MIGDFKKRDLRFDNGRDLHLLLVSVYAGWSEVQDAQDKPLCIAWDSGGRENGRHERRRAGRAGRSTRRLLPRTTTRAGATPTHRAMDPKPTVVLVSTGLGDLPGARTRPPKADDKGRSDVSPRSRYTGGGVDEYIGMPGYKARRRTGDRRKSADRVGARLEFARNESVRHQRVHPVVQAREHRAALGFQPGYAH